MMSARNSLPASPPADATCPPAAGQCIATSTPSLAAKPDSVSEAAVAIIKRITAADEGDHYAVLEIPNKELPPAQLRKVCSSLALKIHSEKCPLPAATGAFQRAIAAHEALQAEGEQTRCLEGHKSRCERISLTGMPAPYNNNGTFVLDKTSPRVNGKYHFVFHSP